MIGENVKEREVLERLDRIIELLEIMTNDESKSIKEELKKLHDWQTMSQAIEGSKSKVLQLFSWFGPWIIAIAYVLFEHKMR